MTMFVMAVFFLLAIASSAILSYFETKPQLTVFFKDEKDKASIDQLTERLKATGKIAEIRFISKEQALSIYREQNKNDPLLLEMVTADILPASLEISAVSPKSLVELSDLVKKEPGVDEVIFQKDVVDALVSWTSTIRKVGLIFIIFLTTSTILILLTNIGIKISSRKEEIEILKLVGATSWYIRKPFIFEGILLGIVGSTLSWIAVMAIMLYLMPFVSAFLKGIPSLSLLKIDNFLTIFIWPPSLPLYLLVLVILLIFGFMIGLLGSLFAVSRYLK